MLGDHKISSCRPSIAAQNARRFPALQSGKHESMESAPILLAHATRRGVPTRPTCARRPWACASATHDAPVRSFHGSDPPTKRTAKRAEGHDDLLRRHAILDDERERRPAGEPRSPRARHRERRAAARYHIGRNQKIRRHGGAAELIDVASERLAVERPAGAPRPEGAVVREPRYAPRGILARLGAFAEAERAQFLDQLAATRLAYVDFHRNLSSPPMSRAGAHRSTMPCATNAARRSTQGVHVPHGPSRR